MRTPSAADGLSEEQAYRVEAPPAVAIVILSIGAGTPAVELAGPASAIVLAGAVYAVAAGSALTSEHTHAKRRGKLRVNQTTHASVAYATVVVVVQDVDALIGSAGDLAAVAATALAATADALALEISGSIQPFLSVVTEVGLHRRALGPPICESWLTAGRLT